MPYDRADHVAVVRDRQEERIRAAMPLVRLITSAAPVMDALTKDPNWDRYLTYLQGTMENFGKAADNARSKLGSRSLTNEELQKLNFDAMVADATIQALQLAINLPKAIMGGHDEAKRIIAQFEKKNESATESKS